MKLNVPNVAAIKVSRVGDVEFLKQYGLDKAIHEMDFAEGENGELNRYLKDTEDRLRELAVNRPEDFWRLAYILLRSSKAHRLLGLRNVRPNWYKDLVKIMDDLEALNGICNRPHATFPIKRTGIPKPDGGTRFINNPGLAMRIYLWMWNYFLSIWCEARLSKHQHGHRSGKGSVTCWEEILDNVEDYPYIYEGDFAKFHDNIDRNFLRKSLLGMGLPAPVVRDLIHLSSAYVKGVDAKDPMTNIVWPGAEYQHFYKGVVQGSNIAGLLGLSVLQELKVYDHPDFVYIGYADDFILLMKNPKGLEEFKKLLRSEESGVSLKPSKCRWVRENGEWKHDLRFVGARLANGTDLYAATHSGKEHHFCWKRRVSYTIGDLVGWEKWEHLDVSNFYKTLRKERCRKGSSARDSAKPGPDLTWRNGRQYNGFLFSKIWSDQPYDNPDPQFRKELEGVPGCFMEEMKITGDLETVSTSCYTALRRSMECQKEKHQKQKIVYKHSHKGCPKARLVDFGFMDANGEGYMSGNDKSYLIGTDSPAPTPYFAEEGENFVVGNLLAKWGPSMTKIQQAFANKKILKVNQSIRSEWLQKYRPFAPRFDLVEFNKTKDRFYNKFYTNMNTKLYVRRTPASDLKK